MLETRATGKQLKSMLSTITKESMTSGGALGDMSTLWELLPDNVAGPIWVAEVVDSARTLADWLDDDREYSLDDLRELSGQLADSETEDYYSNINRRVQELSLWAITDLDEEVVNSGIPCLTLTDMNSAYLYCAMRGLYETLMQWVIDRAEELEEVA